jgi:hypothetical protein
VPKDCRRGNRLAHSRRSADRRQVCRKTAPRPSWLASQFESCALHFARELTVPIQTAPQLGGGRISM